MSGHVQLVLREDVQHLGQAGDLVRVRSGYARNFLLPRGMAAVATRGSIEQVENQRKAAVARAGKLKKGAEAFASTLSAVTVEISRAVGEGERLFGSVTTRDVVEALAALVPDDLAIVLEVLNTVRRDGELVRSAARVA